VNPTGVLETVLYATDLDAAEAFYRDVLGLDVVGKVEGRHVFFRLGQQMLLLFNPAVTAIPLEKDAPLPVPHHGAVGPGHVCFRATGKEIEAWRAHLLSLGIAIEADFHWPNGGRSIYFRDPAGNALEFAEARIWDLDQ
jgi:catechol 2,3-dioxygenase-like lactoylglutathione lyase family enzyme